MRTVSYVDISESALTTLSGLGSITDVRTVTLRANPLLKDTTWLTGLTSLGNLKVVGNPLLVKLKGPDIDKLWKLQVHKNQNLVKISGFGGVETVNTVELMDNPALRDLTGFDALTTIENLTILRTDRLRALPESLTDATVKYCPAPDSALQDLLTRRGIPCGR